MSAEPQLHKIDPDHERELQRRLERADASHTPVVLEIGGRRFRLVPLDDDNIQTTDDPVARYDPAKALAPVEDGFGAFETMDVESFLAEILAARAQDTPGHSF